MKARILTLTSRPERMNSARELKRDVSALGFDVDYERAVDCGKGHWKQQVRKFTTVRNLKPGAICCAEGHLRICEMAVKSGQPVLALEDDTILIDGSALQSLEIPEGFDWIQLHHGSWNKPPWVPVEERETVFKVSRGHWGTVSYIMSPEFAAKTIERQSPIEWVADVWFKYLQDGDQGYVSKAEIFRHRGTVPTIVQRKNLRRR